LQNFQYHKIEGEKNSEYNLAEILFIKAPIQRGNGSTKGEELCPS
jgi:hypothetical protein